jgi:hypothetical protein
VLAAVLVYVGPSGTDFAEHAFQERLYAAYGRSLHGAAPGPPAPARVLDAQPRLGALGTPRSPPPLDRRAHRLAIIVALALPALSMNSGQPNAVALSTTTPGARAARAAAARRAQRRRLPCAHPHPRRSRGRARIAAIADRTPGVCLTLNPDSTVFRQANDAFASVIPIHEGDTAAGAIAIVTFLLRPRAFRSIVLAAKAVVLNVGSLGASYGLLVLFWQQDHGSKRIYGVPPQPRPPGPRDRYRVVRRHPPRRVRDPHALASGARGADGPLELVHASRHLAHADGRPPAGRARRGGRSSASLNWSDSPSPPRSSTSSGRGRRGLTARGPTRPMRLLAPRSRRAG